jgi:S1-C subfamily serine protease
VQPGSPAGRAGLREGDRILEVDRVSATGLIDLNRKICASPDHKVTLSVRRGEARLDPITVTMVGFPEMIQNKLGLTLREVRKEDKATTGFQPGQGLLIEAVQKGSPAERAQLQPNLLVTAIDGASTGGVMLAGMALSGKQQGDRVTVTVVVPQRLGNFVHFTEARVEIQVR